MRVVPMDGMVTVDLQSERGTRTYRQARDGTMTVPEGDARRLLKEGVVVRAGAAGPTAHIAGGYTCPGCGRRNYFRRCSACGSDA
jgi:hypothetical protein